MCLFGETSGDVDGTAAASTKAASFIFYRPQRLLCKGRQGSSEDVSEHSKEFSSCNLKKPRGICIMFRTHMWCLLAQEMQARRHHLLGRQPLRESFSRKQDGFENMFISDQGRVG